LLRALVAFAVLLLALYLLREPLFARPLGRLLGGQLSTALGGQFEVAAVRGNWFTELVIEDLRTIESPGTGPVHRLGAKRVCIRYSPWSLLTADPLAKIASLELEQGLVDLRLGRDAPREDSPPFDWELSALRAVLEGVDETRLPALDLDAQLIIDRNGAPVVHASLAVQGTAGQYTVRSPELSVRGESVGSVDLTGEVRGGSAAALTVAGNVGEVQLTESSLGWEASGAVTAQGVIQVAGAHIDFASDPSTGWELSFDEINLALLPPWVRAVAAVPERHWPQGGAVRGRVHGAWPPSDVQLELTGSGLALWQRELDELAVSLAWANGELNVHSAQVVGLATEGEIRGLRLGLSAPYLRQLDHLQLRYADVSALGALLGMETLPRAELTVDVAVRAQADGGLQCDLRLGSEASDISGSVTLGPQLLTSAWAETSLAAQLGGALALPDEGLLTCEAELTGTLGNPAGHLRVEGRSVPIGASEISTLDVELALSQGVATIANWVVESPAGRVDLSGALDLRRMRLLGGELVIAVRDLQRLVKPLGAKVPMRGRGTVVLRYDGALDPELALSEGVWGMSAAIDELSYDLNQVKALRLEAAMVGGQPLLEQLSVQLDGKVALRMTKPTAMRIKDGQWATELLDLRGAGPTAIQARAEGSAWHIDGAHLRISALPAGTLLPPGPTRPALAGSWSATIDAEQLTGIPRLKAELSSEELRIDGARVRIAAQLQQDGRRILINQLSINGDSDLDLDVTGSLPWWVHLGGLSVDPADAVQLDLTGNCRLEHPAVSALLGRLGLADPLRGQVAVKLKSKSAGGAVLAEGSLQISDLQFRNHTGALAFQFNQGANSLSIQQLKLDGDSGLRLRGDGQLPVRLQPDGFSRTTELIKAQLEGLIPCEQSLSGVVLSEWLGVELAGALKIKADIRDDPSRVGNVPAVSVHLDGVDLRLADYPVSFSVEATQSEQGIVLKQFAAQGGEALSADLTGELPWVVTRNGVVATPGAPRMEGHVIMDLDEGLFEELVADLGRGRFEMHSSIGEGGQDRLYLNVQATEFRPIVPGFNAFMAALPGINGHALVEADPEGWRAEVDMKGIGHLTGQMRGPIGFALAQADSWWQRAWEGEASGAIRFALDDLSPLGRLIPVVDAIGGSLLLDVEFTGSLAQPRVGAELRLSNGLVRTRTGLPTVSGIDSVLALEGERIHVRRFTANLGRQALHLKGSIPRTIVTGDWDLHATGDNLLLFRNDRIRLRADLDCKLSGPWSGFALSGSSGITDFVYAETIPLLDLGGSGSTSAPQVDMRLFALDAEPFASMSFAVRVQDGPLRGVSVREEPVRILTSLARAALGLRAELQGTGRKPALVGKVVVRHGLVFMPFGVYRIREGEIRYREGRPNNPDIRATAVTRIHSYDVTVLVTGTLIAPQVHVSTAPFLDERDAILLATTGLLPSAIDSRSQAAMGTAAAYLGRQFVGSMVDPEQDNPLAFLNRMQLQVATSEQTGGVSNARLQIPLRWRWYGWGEYRNTDYYSAYNGGLGYVLMGRGYLRDDDVLRQRESRPRESGDAPPWRVEAPSGIDHEAILDSAAHAHDDFLRSGYDVAAVDDAAYAMARHMRGIGYANAEVTFRHETAPREAIAFVVMPGVRFRLREARVLDVETGAVMAELRAGARGLLAVMPDIDPNLVEGLRINGRDPYSEAATERLSEALGRLLRYAGYRESVVGPVLATYDAESGSAYVDVMISLGPRYLVTDARLELIGEVDATLAAQLQASVAELQGRPWLERRLMVTQSLLQQMLGDAGYLRASVESLVADHPDGRVEVRYRVTPGPRHRLREVRVHWIDSPKETRRTRDSFVSYRFPARRGEVLTRASVQAGVRQLLSSGFLSDVRTELRDVSTEEARQAHGLESVSETEQVVDIVVSLKEERARAIDLEVGIGTYDIVIARLRFIDRNLFGSGRIFELVPEVSTKGWSITSTLIDRDWLARHLGPDHWLEFSASYLEREEPTFERRGWEAGVGLRKDWGPHLSTTVGYTFSSQEARNVTGGISEIDEAGFINNGTFGLTGRLDYRDHPALTTRGWLGEAGTAWSTPPFGSDLDYFELDLRSSYTFDISRGGGLTFTIGGNYTSRDPLDNAPTLPVQFRLFNGGASSVRSFAFNELSPVDEQGNAIGGLSRGAATGELRLRVFDSPWHVAAFYDVGFVDERPYRIGEDLGQAIGGGIRYDLPIGPIRIDGAWNPGELFAADDDWAIQFAIGNIY
jgi:outer membrane protein insertion porin family